MALIALYTYINLNTTWNTYMYISTHTSEHVLEVFFWQIIPIKRSKEFSFRMHIQKHILLICVPTVKPCLGVFSHLRYNELIFSCYGF